MNVVGKCSSQRKVVIQSGYGRLRRLCVKEPVAMFELTPVCAVTLTSITFQRGDYSARKPVGMLECWTDAGCVLAGAGQCVILDAAGTDSRCAQMRGQVGGWQTKKA